MNDTVFAKIIAGEIPTHFEYEDDVCVVFKSIDPKDKTHLLVVPRKPIPSIMDMEEGDEEIVGHLVLVAKNMAKERGLKGYQLWFNVGKDGGQEIFHLHLHLISKFA
jgi:histidine triad (HIT) family protein